MFIAEEPQPPSWPGWSADWWWSEDAHCWVRDGRVSSPPTAYALDDRLAHAAYGLDSYGVVWACSTKDHWHCMVDVTHDQALRFVTKGEYLA